MTAKTGASTTIILKKGSVFGTAVQGGAGDKLIVNSLTHGRNPTALTSNPIGSGLDMLDSADLGQTSPAVQFEFDAAYSGTAQLAQALFFGADSVVSQGSGAYAHSMMYNATRTATFGTVAFDAAVGSVMEYASCFAHNLSVSVESDNYVKKTLQLLADKQVISSTVNTPASLAAATGTSPVKVVARTTDKFRINAQAGAALADSDVFNIKSAEITYDCPLEVVRELKNAAGNGLPITSGSPPFSCTLKVDLRNNTDMTYWTAAVAGTEYKADLTITSSVAIGGAFYYKEIYLFPRLKLLADPEWGLANAGDNPVSLTFTALTAPSVPSGFTSVYPSVTTFTGTPTSYV